MSLDQERRLEEVFSAARGLPAQERTAFLERACGGDAELRRQADSLFAAHDQAGQFLQPTVTLSLPNAPVEKPGDRIGRYKLLEQIGEGGFGVVWMAEQEEPVRRRVAFKIIKLGMDTKEVVARFEAERQALAMMDHPSIASVFDGGATDTGRPYFVMELVKGISITQFCDERKLSTRERLELFMQVCQAVQHAHQKGIIHRDLKPTNVLVTVKDDHPVPKVIDFGVAKATQARLTDKTLFTRFQQWIGTPAYMSPEQAGLGSLDVDTRSDIYSLGVLLYELLTGRTPFDTQKLLESGYEAVMQTIREEEPPKPSTRLSTLSGEELNTVAARRGSDPAKLNRLVRGDLDWIVMKALEKDRRRRYETANALALDLEHHLGNEPVSAVRPSALYTLQKLMHNFIVNSAQFSPDGQRVVTASDSNTARVWDARTGQPLTEPLMHNSFVLSAQFSPDGQRVVTASADGTARLWDARTGRPLTDPLKHNDGVCSAQFSPDGQRVVTASGDGARVWDVPVAPLPAPQWLLDLVEAVGGKRINQLGVPESDPGVELMRLKRQVAERPSADYYSRWARWFFADRAARTISPNSSITVADYVQRRIQENSLESLQEAVCLLPTNGLAFARLAKQVLAQSDRDNQRRAGEADFFSRRATELSPNDTEVQRIRAEILRQIRNTPKPQSEATGLNPPPAEPKP
jgi:serine/threonine protein kinase